jgi:hypothetical protein
VNRCRWPDNGIERHAVPSSRLLHACFSLFSVKYRTDRPAGSQALAFFGPMDKKKKKSSVLRAVKISRNYTNHVQKGQTNNNNNNSGQKKKKKNGKDLRVHQVNHPTK